MVSCDTIKIYTHGRFFVTKIAPYSPETTVIYIYTILKKVTARIAPNLINTGSG